ncbi:hypothetical protein AB1Y20_010858 [Prymnesium parvum]|uniref:Uncharacterized protein n=1 Tax=Prymnesium parvum TaxID=97485 RepID=A0AB34ISH4_PRYPA
MWALSWSWRDTSYSARRIVVPPALRRWWKTKGCCAEGKPSSGGSWRTEAGRRATHAATTRSASVCGVADAVARRERTRRERKSVGSRGAAAQGSPPPGMAVHN